MISCSNWFITSTLEQVLRAYTNCQQDDWATWLPSAQFEANNTRSKSTLVTPFMAVTGQNPRMGFEPPTGIQHLAHQALQVREANEMIDKMADIEQFIREEMIWAQAMQEEYATENILACHPTEVAMKSG
jgi:hypothetical protein